MRPTRSSSISSVSSTSSLSSQPQQHDNNEEPTIQIFVKNIAGNTIPLTLPTSTSISTLRSLLALRTNLPQHDLRLVFAGKHLPGSSTLADSQIRSESTLHLALPLRGGMAPKLPKCDFKKDSDNACKSKIQPIVGECGFCSGKFCSKHRLLESHNCTGLEDCKKESHERNAAKLEGERTVAIRGI